MKIPGQSSVPPWAPVWSGEVDSIVVGGFLGSFSGLLLISLAHTLATTEIGQLPKIASNGSLPVTGASKRPSGTATRPKKDVPMCDVVPIGLGPVDGYPGPNAAYYSTACSCSELVSSLAVTSTSTFTNRVGPVTQTLTTVTNTAFSPPRDCCIKCWVDAEDVEILYWPVETASPSLGNSTVSAHNRTGLARRTISAPPDAYSLVSNGITYVSPSIYVSYHNLQAKHVCPSFAGEVTRGPPYNTVIAYAPDRLSTPACIDGEPEPFGSYAAINYTDYQFSTSSWSECAKKMKNGESKTSIGPYFSLPREITSVDPDWSTCSAVFGGVFDPPHALVKEAELAPTDPASATHPLNPPPQPGHKPEQDMVAPTPTPDPEKTPAVDPAKQAADPGSTKNEPTKVQPAPDSNSTPHPKEASSPDSPQQESQGEQPAPDPDQKPATNDQKGADTSRQGAANNPFPPGPDAAARPPNGDTYPLPNSDPPSPPQQQDLSTSKNGISISNNHIVVGPSNSIPFQYVPPSNDVQNPEPAIMNTPPPAPITVGNYEATPLPAPNPPVENASQGSDPVDTDGVSPVNKEANAGANVGAGAGVGGVVIAGSTYSPGVPTALPDGTPLTVGSDHVNLGGSSYALPPPEAPTPLLVGGKNIVINAGSGGGVVIGSETIGPGVQTIIDGHAVSVDRQDVIVDGQTHAIAAPSANAHGGQGAAHPVINFGGGAAVTAGGAAATVSGATISLDSDGKSMIVNGQSFPAPTSPRVPTHVVIAVAGQTITPAPQGFAIAGQTVSPGGRAVIVDGTEVSLGQSGSLRLGSSTTVLSSGIIGSAITIAGHAITAASSGFVIGSQTVSPGGAAVTVDGTVVSLGPGGSLRVGSSSAVLGAATEVVLTVAGQVVTAKAEGFVVDGQTVAPVGTAVTVDGTVVSLGSSGSLRVGTSTTVLGSASTGDGRSGEPTDSSVSGVPFTGSAPLMRLGWSCTISVFNFAIALIVGFVVS